MSQDTNQAYAGHTPMMQQYLRLKDEAGSILLFYRMGDFYEMFFDDAIIAARELEITLTGKDCGQEERAPMAGVPHHSVDKYIARLVAHGYKVAIAEQMSEPKTGQIVERKVTQIITPATFIEESKKEFVYLSAITYT